MKCYYIYRITNIFEKKHYYGYRGTNSKPENDLGKKYFSSSTDREFIKLQKTNPEKFRYKVIKVYTEKKEAILAEVNLHKKFDVKSNPSFYNLSNQLSLGFAANNKGKPGLKGTDNGMARKINIYDSNRNLVFSTHGTFGDVCRNNNLPTTMLSQSYRNHGQPIFLKKDKNTWAKKNGYKKYIGWYALYDEEDNHTEKEYDRLKEIEINTIHQNSKEIKIYNSDRILMYIVNDNFFEFCDNMSLPKSALNVSQNNNGEPIFQTMYGSSRATKNNQGKFIGWYAKIGDNLTESEYNKKVEEIKNRDLETRKKRSISLSTKKINGKKINIYNSENKLMFETCGDFKEVIQENNLPYSLGGSHRNNGKPIFSTKSGITKAINTGMEQYIGWYAKKCN